MHKNCEECGVEFEPESNRQKYCKTCQPVVRRRQKQEQHARQKWLQEPETLQERIAAVSNWQTTEYGSDHEKIHPEDVSATPFTTSDHYTDEFIYLSDYLKELEDPLGDDDDEKH
jgi:hypothetical protein